MIQKTSEVKFVRNGVNAVQYTLYPSASSAVIGCDGTVSPSSVTCSIKKVDGNAVAFLAYDNAAGYTVKYAYNDGDMVDYSGAVPVNVNVAKITFYLYRDSEIIDSRDIPVIVDGKNGTAVYTEEQYSADGTSDWHDDFLAADYFKRYRTVTNDGEEITYSDWSDGVRCRKDGEDGYTPVKGVDYFDGKDGSFVSFIYKLSDTSLTPTGGSYDGSVETFPDGWSDNPVYSTSMKTQVSTTRYTKSGDTWTNSGWSASVQYTGENAVQYSLLPSVSSVSVLSGGTISPASVSCQIKRTNGSVVNIYDYDDDEVTGYSIRYMLGGDMVTYAGAVTVSSSATKLTLYLYMGDYKIDQADIPIVKDGANGESGKAPLMRYRYAYDKPATPSDENPSGWLSVPTKENIVITNGTTWSLKNGYYESPDIGHNASTYNVVSFTTTLPNQIIPIKIKTSCDSDDYLYVGYLDDSSNIVTSSNYYARLSGINSQVLYMPVIVAGAHTIVFKYIKDNSGTSYLDKAYYRVLDCANCWMSQGTYSSYGSISWSSPVLFIPDSGTTERIYVLAKTTASYPSQPSSDAYIDDCIPAAATDAYSSGDTYAAGNIVVYNGVYKECIQACTGVAPSNTSYWQTYPWWTDDPSGVSEAYPYLYYSERTKTNGKWGAYSAPKLYVNYSKGGDNAVQYSLYPSATSVIIDSSNIASPSELTCKIKETDGDSVSVLEYNGASGYEIKYKYTEEGTPQAYTTVQVTSSIEKVIWLLYYGNILVDRFDVPIVKNGAAGTQGTQGARMKWVDWDTTNTWLSGTDGEDWQYYTYYSGHAYLCLISFSKSTYTKTPAQSVTDNDGYFAVADEVFFSFIKYLIVNKITADMIDVNSLIVQILRTADTGARIEIQGSMMEVYGNTTCNIRSGVDENGMAILTYYDNSGKKLYDLGPEGIKSVSRSENSFSSYRYKYLGTSLSTIFSEKKYKSCVYSDTVPLYTFHSGYIGEVYNDSEHDGLVYTSASVNASNLATGWYIVGVQSSSQHYVPFTYLYNGDDGTVTGLPGQTPYNERIIAGSSHTILYVKLIKFTAGVESDTYTAAYWNVKITH